MVTTEFFTFKGGQGCTVTAAMYALRLPGRVLIIDRCGDMAAALGMPTPPDGEVVKVTDRLDLYVGDGITAAGPMVQDYAHVVVDSGQDPVYDLSLRILVTRPCYLALRRAVAGMSGYDRVVLITEPGRALTARDVEHTLGKPVTEIPWDPAVARAVDAGLLASRVPASTTALRHLTREDA